jgi:hypothetical protein
MLLHPLLAPSCEQLRPAAAIGDYAEGHLLGGEEPRDLLQFRHYRVRLFGGLLGKFVGLRDLLAKPAHQLFFRLAV